MLRLADAIDSLGRPHPARVAIDGPDAAGKTTLADELAVVLRSRGRIVVRASIDDFDRPRADRYQRGRDSPVGYYEDAFDLDALRRRLLDPLGPMGSRTCSAAIYGYVADRPLAGDPITVPPDAVLLLDGVFLLRLELVAFFDLSIHVRIGWDEVVRRGVLRDAVRLGSAEEAERQYGVRYFPAQRLYVEQARPADCADFVVDNDDPAAPTLLARRSSDPE